MKKIVIFTIIIGAIGIGLNTIFGWDTFSWLQVYRTDSGLYLYKLDAWGYISNLKNSFTNVSQLGIEAMPETDYVWYVLINTLTFMANILTWQFRVGGYLLLNVLALLGINVIDADSAGGLQWLVTICQFLRDLSFSYMS